jgi:ankyrin repeat protein
MSEAPKREKPAATIYDACRTGDTDRVAAYLANNGCVTDSDSNRMTMLHHAAFGGQMDAVKGILALGASGQKLDLDALDVAGFAPLHYAVDRGHLDVVKVLLEEGANVNTKDENRRTPLHLAALKGHGDMVRLLLGFGAVKNVKSVSGVDALGYAQASGNADAIAALS